MASRQLSGDADAADIMEIFVITKLGTGSEPTSMLCFQGWRCYYEHFCGNYWIRTQNTNTIIPVSFSVNIFMFWIEGGCMENF